MEIRVCTDADVACLAELDLAPRELAHHLERWQMQQRGDATYILAWDRRQPVGRVTLFRSSKYQLVRDHYGNFPEMNALEATPQGQGVGSAIIRFAEQLACAASASRVGLGVEPDNVGARRLYERFGYADWPHGYLLDRWTERDDTGRVIREHADQCDYLIKELS